MVRPALEWGGFLLEDCNDKIKKKIEVVQNNALRRCLGCIRTTPINVLLHLGGISPLGVRRENLTKKFLVRQNSFKDSLLIPKLTLLGEYIDRMEKCPNYIIFYLYKMWAAHKNEFSVVYKNEKSITYTIPYNIQFSTLNINFEFGKEVKRSKNRRIYFNKFVINQNAFNKLIYTDGSKMEGKCRCGVFLENLVALKCRVNDKNSIYSAEACAIYHAPK